MGVVCEMKADPKVEVANYLKACNVTLHGTTESTFAFAHCQAMQTKVAKHFEAASDRVKQTGHAAGDAAAHSAAAIQVQRRHGLDRSAYSWSAIVARCAIASRG